MVLGDLELSSSSGERTTDVDHEMLQDVLVLALGDPVRELLPRLDARLSELQGGPAPVEPGGDV